MASWTLPADIVEVWIGDDAPTDSLLIDKWIGKAEREIRFRVPDLQARLDTEADLLPAVTELLDTARDVVVAMVTRVFRNPEGLRQKNVTTTTGPFGDTGSVIYGGNTPGELALTDDELSKLSGVVSRGAFTISMIPSTSPFYGG
jgi:hypothetical protein